MSDPLPAAAWPSADPRLCLRGQVALAPFNQATLLQASDVHVAGRLSSLAGGCSDEVTLAAALVVRALRLGHVCVDLTSVQSTVIPEVEGLGDVSALPWPDPARWLGLLAASALVASGEGDQSSGLPLRLDGNRLYLERYWRQECLVAADIAARAARTHDEVDHAMLRDGIERLFPAEERAPGDELGTAEEPGPGGERAADPQRLAAAAAVVQGLTVIAGGPGTGKTTTVARILALMDEQATAAAPPRVALAAPTGKAAARLEEAVHAEARTLDVATHSRGRLLAVQASTLHRLLGWRPDSNSRFRHDRRNRLPHDVVIVDETSMVSLSLMAKLLEAVRPDARLILLGDPEQLASVEAGAVLGDIVGPARRRLIVSAAARTRLEAVTGQVLPAGGPQAGVGLGDGIVVLRRVHRFGGSIARLARVIQSGDEDRALDLLRRPDESLRWIPAPPDGGLAESSELLVVVRDRVIDAGRRLVEAAEEGDGAAALEALGSVRVLCAHRRGSFGVEAWTDRVEGWLRAAIGDRGKGPWYVGRPLLVTANNYELQLYNGDTGVVVAGPDGATAVFERRGELASVNPARLESVETLRAMTVHKSQGSQFESVVVVLPEPTSRVLTRELLYTAVTRARHDVTLVASEASVRAALGRRIARASGLRDRLWGATPE
ncbi:MAG: exodeoxyribonuclease V subunit alpha [Acidimicrobiales bacterium]